MLAILLIAASSTSPLFLSANYDMAMAGFAILLNLPFIVAPAPVLLLSFLSYIASSRISSVREETMLTVSRTFLVVSLAIFGIVTAILVLPLWGTGAAGSLAVVAAAGGIAAELYILSRLGSEVQSVKQEENINKPKRKIPSWVWMIGVLLILVKYQQILHTGRLILNDSSLMLSTILGIGGVIVAILYIRSKMQKRQTQNPE